MQLFLVRCVWSRSRWVLVVLLSALLAGCAAGPGQPTVQPSPGQGGTPTVGLDAPSETVPIVISEPSPGMRITSPQVLRGRLAAAPPAGGLIYRLLDAENIVIGTGSVQASGEVGGVGSFEVQVVYTSLADTLGMLQVVQRNNLSGPVVALASQVVFITQNVTTPPTADAIASTGTPDPNGALPSITPVPPTATPLPTVEPQGQVITITSPPAGTQVGSPLTVAGTTSQFPFGGNLDYRFVDAANNQIGQGSFPVNGAPGQPSSFTAELRFNPPAAGGPVRLDLYDQNTSGQVAALASLNLNVAAPLPTAGAQQITIASPPSGTTVGSPVVITGGTTRFPANGTLKWRMIDAAGNQLGTGAFAVSGSAGQPATFNSLLVFNQPTGGGIIRLELADRDANTGQTVATSILDLNVAGPPTVVPQQSITITSPPPGTQVGSPMTITGNVANYPTNGNLGYRVFNSANQQIGVGAFPVTGAIGQPATFTAQIVFTPPPVGGDIRVEVIDRNDASGTVLASSSIGLRVAPQPGPATPVPPVPTSTPVTVGQQQIRVTEPISGTTVSSPLVITGTLSMPPQDGNLFYVVRDAAGAELGSGTFNVPPVGNVAIPFTATLLFTAPPAGTVIQVELLDQSERERVAPRARTEMRYVFQPRAQPR